MTGWKGIMQEIYKSRWNKSTASAIAPEIQKLEKIYQAIKYNNPEAANSFGTINIDMGDGNGKTDHNIESFFKKAKEYGSQVSDDVRESIKKAILENKPDKSTANNNDISSGSSTAQSGGGSNSTAPKQRSKPG